MKMPGFFMILASDHFRNSSFMLFMSWYVGIDPRVGINKTVGITVFFFLLLKLWKCGKLQILSLWTLGERKGNGAVSSPELVSSS